MCCIQEAILCWGQSSDLKVCLEQKYTTNGTVISVEILMNLLKIWGKKTFLSLNAIAG